MYYRAWHRQSHSNTSPNHLNPPYNLIAKKRGKCHFSSRWSEYRYILLYSSQCVFHVPQNCTGPSLKWDNSISANGSAPETLSQLHLTLCITWHNCIVGDSYSAILCTLVLWQWPGRCFEIKNTILQYHACVPTLCQHSVYTIIYRGNHLGIYYSSPVVLRLP